MNITMLGTGNAMVTECYNTCFVLQDGEKHLLVDGGGGNTLLRQLKQAGFDWKDMREIFVTHKHVDHLMGIVWMIRMICQHMKQGQYEGEAWIYGHDEVIGLLGEMAEQLYPKKLTDFIGKRLHLVVVNDGEERTLMGHKVTFFDIQSTKANNTDSAWTWETAKNSPAVVMSHIMNVRKNMPKTANGCFTRLFACMTRRMCSIHMKSIIPQRKMPVSSQNRLA